MGTFSVILVSNSRILKDKFLRLFNVCEEPINDQNLNINCYNLTLTHNNNLISSKIIDTSEKNLIKKLATSKIFKVVYLLDQSNSDTLAYIQSIHTELTSNSKFILCNLSNSLAIVPKTERNISNTLNLLNEFLKHQKEIDYLFYDNSNESLFRADFIKKLLEPTKDIGSMSALDYSKNSLKTKQGNAFMKSKSATLNGKISSNYQGEIQNGLRHGYGVYFYENSFFRYEGEWLNGLKHGRGKLIMKDGSFYEGDFKDGEIYGKGRKFIKLKSMDYYGEFFDGQFHGKGKLKSLEHDCTYEGDFIENMRHGFGEYIENRTNAYYKGQWYHDKRHGIGYQRYPNGSTYNGDWIKNKRQGHGELKEPNGICYEGQFRNDLFNGHGIYVHPTGYTYEGLFENGLPKSMASQLKILCNLNEIDEELSSFDVEIQSLNDDDKVTNESGRLIQLSIAIKLDISDTNSYDNEVKTEFGFVVIPLSIYNDTYRGKIEINTERMIPEETDSKIDGENNSPNPKVLEAKTQDGKVKFTSLWLKNIVVPQSQEDIITLKSPNKPLVKNNRVVSRGSASESSLRDVSVDSMSSATTVNCVIIAEDVTYPKIFGKSLKSAYFDVVVNLKQIEKKNQSIRSSQSNIAIEKKKQKSLK